MITAAAVKAALYRGELFLEYLPVISLESRRCVGAEALIRWRRGSAVIPPLEFIPLIESTPVSGLVTYWVIDTVAKELAAWLRTHDRVHISINVPPELFGRGALEYAAAKAQVLDLASKVVLEITERGVPDKIGVDALNARGHRGVLIALDDVCASDAGLLVASQVRVDILKIEKSTVEQMTGRYLPPAETAALAALIRSTEVTVVAEGVEDVGQIAKLRNCGIGLAQGWLFSHPLSAAHFMEYFAAHC